MTNIYEIYLWIMYIILFLGVGGITFLSLKIKNKSILHPQANYKKLLGTITISIFEYNKLMNDSLNFNKVKKLILGDNIQDPSTADEITGKITNISELKESIQK